MSKILRGLRHPLESMKKIHKKIEFRQGIAGPIKVLNVQACIACNLRCIMCFQHKALKPGSQAYTKMLDLSLFRKILDEIEPFHTEINLTGGEPMMHPKIDEIIKEVKSRNLNLTITLNGFKLKEKAKMLVDENVDIISISLDGREEINDKNRGNGSYKNAVEGLREVIKYRNECGKKLPKVKVNGTITEITFPYFSDLAEIANDIGIDELWLAHLLFYPQKLIDEQIEWMNKYLKDCFDPDVLEAQAESFKNFVLAPNTPIDPEVVIEQKRILKDKISPKIPFSTLPNYSDDEIRRYYNPDYDSYKKNDGNVCLCSYRALTLASTGDLAFCLGYNAGNIANVNLADIWNNKRTRLFRKAILKHGRFPLCQRCCL